MNDLTKQQEELQSAESYFDGGLFQLIGWSILGLVVTLVTLGIAYPWSYTMIYGWRINHTVINGRRLKFSGSAVGFLVNVDQMV